MRSNSETSSRSASPKVSIGLPVYNGEAFVREAINSILAQTLTDFELIVCDNASTDRTGEICEEFARRDRRVRYVRNPENIGSWRNHDRVAELARGEYFRIASHDDTMDPTYLEKAVSVLDREPTAVMCYAKTRLIDAHGVQITLEQQRQGMRDGYMLDSRELAILPAPIEPAYKGLDDPDAATRFHRAVMRISMCHEIYGVVRMSTLRSAAYMGGYYGSDKVALVNWAAKGRFLMIDEYLMSNRRHAGQSGNIASAWKREAWNDPKAKARRSAAITARLRCYRGYCRAVFEANMTLWQRFRCLLSLVLFWFDLGAWRHVFEDLTDANLRKADPAQCEHKVLNIPK